MKKYKMDLHIHTPASKCYLGPKTDDEYFEILKAAKKQGLEIIAITDHNTIAGYERFVQLKEDVFKKMEFLELYQNESVRIKEEYDDMASKKKLFEDILILPGVEITLNPGIHILVIGNNTDVAVLSEILDDVGYIKEKRGSDNDNAIDVDIINFLKNPKLKGLIVSAPHIDSKNGIFNEMSGHYRSSVMKSEVISSFSVNSDNQKENIVKMMTSDPEYKRDKVPAFIHCSDAHESGKVGNKYSYVELEAKSFSELVSLFDAPEGKVFDTDDDRLVESICEILEREDALLIGNLNENEEEISKVLCAVLNEDIEVLILGVNNNLKLIGVNNTDNYFETKIDKAFELLSSTARRIRYSINTYKLGNGKYVFILFMGQSERYLWYLKEKKEVYYLAEDKPELASVVEIERIVYENTVKDLLQMEQKDEERLNSANIQINSTKCRTDKMFVIKQIIDRCFPILHYCDLEICDASQLSVEDLEKIPENGSVKGNSYYIFKNSLRLNDAILRFSCPTSLLTDDILEKVTLYDVKKDSIVIVRGGGTHYIPEDGCIFGVNEDFIILSKKENADFEMKILLGWMKSSLFAWYIGRKLGSTDIYLPAVLTNTVFPIDKFVDTQELLSSIDNIIVMEYAFLEEYEKLSAEIHSESDEIDNPWLLYEMIMQHNDAIDFEIGDIDEYFFGIYGVADIGKQWISADLKAEGIYDTLLKETEKEGLDE